NTISSRKSRTAHQRVTAHGGQRRPAPSIDTNAPRHAISEYLRLRTPGLARQEAEIASMLGSVRITNGY
ncbi:MAG: hypothetical protein ACRDOU_19795, partial [Streptosporangiaceae bacterium]